MPYFIYCALCNRDGSYQNIQDDCSRCDGKGKDWHSDRELETYHAWAEITLGDLKRKENLISRQGVSFFYRETIPSVEEETLSVIARHLLGQDPSDSQQYYSVDEIAHRILEQKSPDPQQDCSIEDYDYYIEPCQLCLSRNGETYDECGWCHDSDTHFKEKTGRYPGDWIKIPHGGDGYPFHESPHPTREYFKGESCLEELRGVIPPDVTGNCIEKTHEIAPVYREKTPFFSEEKQQCKNNDQLGGNVMGLFGKSYNSWEKEFLTANRNKHTATMASWKLEDDDKCQSKLYRKVKKESDKWIEKERELVGKYPKYHKKYVNDRGTSRATELSKKANRGEDF